MPIDKRIFVIIICLVVDKSFKYRIRLYLDGLAFSSQFRKRGMEETSYYINDESIKEYIHLYYSVVSIKAIQYRYMLCILIMHTFPRD